jgi:hypothetical protein
LSTSKTHGSLIIYSKTQHKEHGTEPSLN